MIKKFPKEIEDFANHFVAMQVKRHRADYSPSGIFYKSSVLQDIAESETVMDQFYKVPIRDRKAFAAFVLFKKRDI